MRQKNNKCVKQKETIHLFLKAAWFLMIASGEKKEEYRQIKPYWTKRLFGYPLKYAIFHKGYTNNNIMIRITGISQGHGRPEWGAVENEAYIILHLGEIVVKPI